MFILRATVVNKFNVYAAILDFCAIMHVNQFPLLKILSKNAMTQLFRETF